MMGFLSRGFVVGLLSFGVMGCGKTITEDDCRAVAANLREAWRAETKDIKATEGPVAEKASGVLKSEEEKLVGSFSAECRSKLVGQEVSSKERRCLLEAKTLAELRKCPQGVGQ